jgi:hypothetical protein
MKRQIIITDLTRFGDENPTVCTAGIDSNTGECIRPMPYLPISECKRLGILPGGILSGEFAYKANRVGPHQEDATAVGLKFHGASSSEAFHEILQDSCFESLETGFEITLPDGDKGVPPDHPVGRSIVTIRAMPESIEIIEDSYRPGKVKLNFREPSGREYRYFPITDLGFHDFAQAHRSDGKLEELNEWINRQREVFLRIGLSRAFQPSGKKLACWMQANGIYTFPDVPPGVRIHVR